MVSLSNFVLNIPYFLHFTSQNHSLERLYLYLRTRQSAYQLLGHFLDLGDEVGEELRHVFLLAGVQRLFVHRIRFTERSRVVRLPLTLLNIQTDKHQQHAG